MTGRLSAVGSAATSFPFSFTEQTNNEIVEKIRKNVLGNMRLGSCSSSSSQFCFFVFDSHAGLALSGVWEMIVTRVVIYTQQKALFERKRELYGLPSRIRDSFTISSSAESLCITAPAEVTK
jgi:hypothetical protein